MLRRTDGRRATAPYRRPSWSLVVNPSRLAAGGWTKRHLTPNVGCVERHVRERGRSRRKDKPDVESVLVEGTWFFGLHFVSRRAQEEGSWLFRGYEGISQPSQARDGDNGCPGVVGYGQDRGKPWFPAQTTTRLGGSSGVHATPYRESDIEDRCSWVCPRIVTCCRKSSGSVCLTELGWVTACPEEAS